MSPLQPPEELLKLFGQPREFFIFGHQEPDGDCIGSQLALASALRRQGSTVTLFNQGPFKKQEVARYAGLFHQVLAPVDKARQPWGLVLDCSTPDRIGDLGAGLNGLSLAVIDHHSAGQNFGAVRYIDPKAVSTTLLIWRLFRALDWQPNLEEAEYLLLGLCTDTGFFRHLEGRSEEALLMAADLSQRGASLKQLHAYLSGGKDLANQVLTGLILSRVESFRDNAILVSWEALDDRSRLGATNRESDQLYQTLQGVEGNEVVVLLREESPGRCSVGLRSRTKVDVGQIASGYGGGGHARASGFLAELPLSLLKAQLLEQIQAQL